MALFTMLVSFNSCLKHATYIITYWRESSCCVAYLLTMEYYAYICCWDNLNWIEFNWIELIHLSDAAYKSTSGAIQQINK